MHTDVRKTNRRLGSVLDTSWHFKTPPSLHNPVPTPPHFLQPVPASPPGSLSKSYIYIWVEKYFRLMELKVTCIVPIPTLAQYLYLTNNRIDIYSSGSHPDTCSISISNQQQNRYIAPVPIQTLAQYLYLANNRIEI